MTTIAIDGPSGSGKSTLGRVIAGRLGLECLDTGAMYRSVALLAMQKGIDAADVDTLVELASAMVLDLGERAILNGEDVTAAIRSPAVTVAVSAVAAQQRVRDELVRRQREWVKAHGGGVVEGRDIGSVVLPDADVKVFLIAAVEERARRRAAEPAEAGGGEAVETYLTSMSARDARDSSREVSPLRPAPDAIEVDSTALAPDEIADLVLAALRARTNGASGTDRAHGSNGPSASAGDTTVRGATPGDAADGHEALSRRAVRRATKSDASLEPTESRAVRPPGKAELAFYALCRAIVVGVSKVYFPGSVIGADRLPRSGPYILAPIHRSYVDWLVAARVTRRRLRFVVKAEVWKVSAVGRLIELLGAFPVHRGNADRESLARCLEVLAIGEPLVVFPEGTRQRGAQVAELAEGAAYMALRSGVPIFPLGLAGTEDSMPRGKKVPRPRRVVLVIGEPLVPARSDTTKRVSRRESTELTAALSAGIQSATDQARTRLAPRRRGAVASRYRRKAVPDQTASAPISEVSDDKL